MPEQFVNKPSQSIEVEKIRHRDSIVLDYARSWSNIPEIKAYFAQAYEAVRGVEEEELREKGVSPHYVAVIEAAKAELELNTLIYAAKTVLRNAGADLSAPEMESILRHVSSDTILKCINHSGFVVNKITSLLISKQS